MFEKGKATISPDSMKVVQAVAQVLKEHDNIQGIEVGGHASQEGQEKANLTLTQQRVDSVVAELVKLGVEKNRLVAQGYGAYCPVDTGTGEASLEKNRRVEFKILQQDGKATDAKRGCDGAAKKVKLKAFTPPKAWLRPRPTPRQPWLRPRRRLRQRRLRGQDHDSGSGGPGQASSGSRNADEVVRGGAPARTPRALTLEQVEPAR